jgi:hypothetical protein
MTLADVDFYDETVCEASIIRTKPRANGAHHTQEAKTYVLQSTGWYQKPLASQLVANVLGLSLSMVQ